MSEDVAIAQIVTAITTVFYAAVFAIGYYLMIKGNRKTLREMRKERLSGGRPQVVIEASLLNLPTVELVVRNESGGAAKDITFDFTAPIEDSSGFILSDLRYLKEGIPFLGAGEKIRCLWDHIDRLEPYLIEKGLRDGIAAKVAYKDLAGEIYETEWRINPLLYEGLRHDASRASQGSSGPLPEKVTEDAKSGKTSEPPRSTRSADGYGSNLGRMAKRPPERATHWPKDRFFVGQVPTVMQNLRLELGGGLPLGYSTYERTINSFYKSRHPAL